MTVKRFEAKDMADALRQIRQELGEDAVILETRKLKSGFMGIGGRERVEVLAGIEPRKEPERDPQVEQSLKSLQALLQPFSNPQPPSSSAASPPTAPPPSTPYNPYTYGNTSSAPQQPPASNSQPAPQANSQPVQPSYSPPVQANANPYVEVPSFTAPSVTPEPPVVDPKRERMYQRLADSGMDARFAEKLLRACEPDLTLEKLAAAVARRIMVSRPSLAEPGTVIALVGPTGVGKTTTAAKLAARYALMERKSVAFITMDTYRIGAVEQIRTYARVMDLPMEVARTPEEMKHAVERHADKDLIVVDTVGRSPQKGLQIAEIKSYLNAAKPAEVYLTLAAPYGLSYLFDAAEQFSTLEPTGLILTKLDEFPSWGAGVSLVERSGIPLAYVTDGQEVPHNIRPANAEEIAQLVVGGGK